ncbi:MAG: putative metal-binding protein [Saliniramus fredricksonii]|uniref:Putative metal-binding protein n=1 Tax=Saliniramus fredricksonii TaxID=1653334 RepID=A0A0P7X3Z0_9HYPH|nr:MAG: putative metal-binding protein [Saliniramus fredricksonii]SCC79078.1 Uncharacterized conserved protein [Saliniramus fredricksonii]
MNRRRFLAGSGAAFAIATMPAFAAPAAETMIVHYDPGCGCCSAWVGHMREAGFAVETRATSQINRIKARLGVPPGLASCHTAEIAGYVVEGHVPAEAVTRLLRERPDATGISVPGMPIGSPGMEVPGMEDDAYAVVLFEGSRSESFARYRGVARTDP